MVHRLLLSFVVASTLFGSDGHKHSAPSTPNDGTAKMFDRLRSLAGDWVVTGETEAGKTTISYRVTAGGSAIIETIFPGTDMEMVSVYHRDGKELVMTHYCMVGNQPRMRAKLGDDPNRLVFEFIGGTNIDPDKDSHIHGGVIEFVDPDRVRSAWDYYSSGKLAERHAFELTRKK